MRGTLLVNQSGGHNKFYLIYEMARGILCKYGRIDSHLRYERVQAEKEYPGKGFLTMKNSKINTRGYEEVFDMDADNPDEIWESAVEWAKTGRVPTGELVATEYLAWFDGGDE